MSKWRPYLGLLMFPIFASILCLQNPVYAADDSISISLSSSNLILDANSDQFSSITETVSVSTNNDSGYSLNIKTTGTSSSLKNTISDDIIETFTIPNGSKTVPRSNSGYGYGYSIDNGNNYYAAPEPTDNDVLLFKTNTSGSTDYAVDFGVKPSPTMASGIYENTFVFTAIANSIPKCVTGFICYDGNGDDGTGTMTRQEIASNATSAKLTPPNFSNPGHGFAGWSTEADGSGTIYGPEETVSVSAQQEGGIILYAQWVESSDLMQNWTGCSTLSVGDVIALTDFRDNEVYTVAKLADGNCWMVENLRLNPSKALITKANTNGPTDDFIRDVPLSGSSNSLCATNTQECIDTISYNINSTNRDLSPVSNVNGVSISWYSYGGFYNWHTATAGNGTYSTSSGQTTGDICPVGWRIPTGNGGGEWSRLNTAANNGKTNGDALLRKFPNNFIYSGDYNTNATSGRGVQGRFWSSNAFSNANSYRFGYAVNTVTTANNYNKWAAFAVRCIANTNNPTINGNIHYDANGGTGTMADDTNVNLATASAKANTFVSANGHNFVHWNTEPDDSGIIVKDKDMVYDVVVSNNIGSGDTITLYAIWGKTATLSFDANGGSDAPLGMTEYDSGNDTWIFTIPNHVPTRIDYTFVGWDEDQDSTTATYQPGDTLTTTERSNELFAIWTPTVCEAGHICYRGNGATAGNGIVDTANSNAQVYLKAPDYSRDGYGFVSWNTAIDGSGTNYGPNEKINVGDLSTNGLDLYANWLESSDNLQGWQGCSEMSVGDVIALKDIRDNNVYAISKHNDNHCWFMENLRLDPSTANITAENTNSPTQEFFDKLSNTTGGGNICTINDETCINSITFDTNPINRALDASPDNNQVFSAWHSYGVLYNWYTATAGNGTYATTSGNAAGDICPADWRLPTGGSTGEYKALNQAENNGSGNVATGLVKYPVNIVFSGDHNGNKVDGRNKYTRLWTSTATSATNAYRFGLTSNSVTHSNNWNKWVNFPIRCIAQ